MKKKNINFGFRGWMLLIYQAIAFFTFTVFTNFPMNILADMYGGAQKISTIYTVATFLGIVIQLVLTRFIGKMKSVKAMGAAFGIISLVLALGIMYINPAQQTLWQVVYFLETLFVILYATFALGILVGQWFPRRKGTVMGIATFAFPITNGVIGAFAGAVFNPEYMAASHGVPNVAGAFLPYFIIAVVGLLIGLIFVKDYPEQCGAYRDNDKDFTPEAAQAMLAVEIENKKTSVWTLGNTLKNRDFWFITIPMGALLMCSVGMMTQTSAMIGTYANLNFATVMAMSCVVACFGSWLMGVLDTKFGTKKAVVISVILMIVGGILGSINGSGWFIAAFVCLSIFEGAASNFTVSAAAQYWRREDFSNVFSCVNPIANILQAAGPMMIATILFTKGCQMVFTVSAVIGVVCLVLILLFKPAHVKETDDKYRTAAGKELDDALAGRK